MKEIIGRRFELNYLNEKLNSKKSELIIIYGRRRLGKTKLIKESLKNKNSTYFLLTQEKPIRNLYLLQEVMSENLKNDLIKQLKVHSFEEFFRMVKDIIPENYILALDEFPYLISQDKSIVSQFQKIFDEYFKEKNIKLILCGSSNSIMGDIQSYQSPLYGRRTGVIKLKKFSFFETKEFLNEIKNLKEIMKYQLIFGGVPYYLEQINTNLTFEENISKMFFTNQTIFLDEINFLLKEEFKEIRNYMSILIAISKGKNTFTKISENTYIEKGTLSKYLKSLEIIDLIENIKSFFDKKNSKKSIYELKDNFVYFWYYTIYESLSTLQNKSTQNKILNIKIPLILGKLFEKESKEILSSHFEKVGTYFKSEIEIDILGQNDKEITCFECKFKENVKLNKIINELDEKINFLPNEYEYKKRVISINKDLSLKELLKLSK